MATLNFPTAFSRRGRFHSAAGSRKQPQYKMTVNKETGAHELKQKGEIDLYAQIQSYKDSTDVNYILARFARGDVSALSKIQGTYGDFTEMPKTLAELSQRVIDAENLFYSLPLDVRQKFDHNPSMFFSQLGTEKFNTIWNEYNQKLQPGAAEPEPDPQVPEQNNDGGAINE